MLALAGEAESLDEEFAGSKLKSAVISSSTFLSECRISKISFASGGVAVFAFFGVLLTGVFAGDCVSGITVG